MIFRTALINMPFAAVHIPSLALTQLRAVLERESDGAAQADVFYLNHDFSQFFGLDLYRYLSDDSRTTVTGMTDWIFRPCAFPDAPDVTSEYIIRYSPSLACRCADGSRQELDGCSTAPAADPTEASSVPCCLGPGLLAQVLARRDALESYMDELIERYRLTEYQVVGFTSMFDQTVASIAMARRLKARNPELTTIIGGAGCEPGVARVVAKRVDAIDFAFAGPALRSFPELVGHLMRGEPERCHALLGVYSRQNSGASGAHLGPEDNINRRVALDYDEFLTSVRGKCPDVEPELHFETSRGCWWGERSHCTFCGINGATMTFRAMSPENVVAQFEELFDKYADVTRFVAVDNILEQDYYASVFPRVRAPDGASIFYETRVTTDDEHLRLLSESGVTRIQAGLESLSTPILSLMKKGTSAFTNLQFLKKIPSYDIEVDWNLLTGFPSENDDVYEWYLSVIPLLVHLPAPVATFPVRFDRHSPYHGAPEAHGLDLRPVDFYSLVYPFPQDEIEELAYFWADHNFSNQYLFNLARWQRQIETAVDGWRIRWYQRDGKAMPELRFVDDGNAVYDSRSGEPVEHPLSALGRHLLEQLARPRKRGDLVRVIDAAEEEIETELAALRERGLLFEEGPRMLSLLTSGARAERAVAVRSRNDRDASTGFALPIVLSGDAVSVPLSAGEPRT